MMDNEIIHVIREFLSHQRPLLTRDQWNAVYPSWSRGGVGWHRMRCGGTDIHTALAWYQFIHKPGSREWRPAIIITALLNAVRAPEVTS